MSTAADLVKAVVAGVTDSLSYHRSIPILVNNSSARWLIIQIIGANGLLILGSVYLFNSGILPAVKAVGESAFDINNIDHYNGLLLLLYQSLWLVPICVLCYAVSMGWYQSLSDTILQDKKKPIDPLKSVEFAAYGTIAWACLYLQVQLLTNLVPAVISAVEFVAAKVLVSSDSTPSVTFLSSLLMQSVMVICRAARVFSTGGGLILMCALYGWYAFDPRWISEGVHPDERFSIIEKHVGYFLGFGLPYVLLVKLTPFFVGFGGFLMAYPFCIILGTVTNFEESYRALNIKQKPQVRLFRLAQVWTVLALKYFGKGIIGSKSGSGSRPREQTSKSGTDSAGRGKRKSSKDD